MAATKEKKAETPNTNGNKPVKVFRLKGVKVAIFQNRAKNGEIVFHKTVTQKIYKDGEEFKTTSSLGRDDLPVARLLLQRAYEYILEEEARASAEAREM